MFDLTTCILQPDSIPNSLRYSKDPFFSIPLTPTNLLYGDVVHTNEEKLDEEKFVSPHEITPSMESMVHAAKQRTSTKSNPLPFTLPTVVPESRKAFEERGYIKSKKAIASYSILKITNGIFSNCFNPNYERGGVEVSEKTSIVYDLEALNILFNRLNIGFMKEGFVDHNTELGFRATSLPHVQMISRADTKEKSQEEFVEGEKEEGDSNETWSFGSSNPFCTDLLLTKSYQNSMEGVLILNVSAANQVCSPLRVNILERSHLYHEEILYYLSSRTGVNDLATPTLGCYCLSSRDIDEFQLFMFNIVTFLTNEIISDVYKTENRGGKEGEGEEGRERQEEILVQPYGEERIISMAREYLKNSKRCAFLYHSLYANYSKTLSKLYESLLEDPSKPSPITMLELQSIAVEQASALFLDSRLVYSCEYQQPNSKHLYLCIKYSLVCQETVTMDQPEQSSVDTALEHLKKELPLGGYFQTSNSLLPYDIDQAPIISSKLDETYAKKYLSTLRGWLEDSKSI